VGGSNFPPANRGGDESGEIERQDAKDAQGVLRTKDFSPRLFLGFPGLLAFGNFPNMAANQARQAFIQQSEFCEKCNFTPVRNSFPV